MSTSAYIYTFFLYDSIEIGYLDGEDIAQSMNIFIIDTYYFQFLILLSKNKMQAQKVQQAKTLQQNWINLLIVTELKKQISVELTNQAIFWIKTYNKFIIFTEDNKVFPGTQLYDKEIHKIQYIISIGQNSTMMRALRLSVHQDSIPVISISDGDEPIMSSYTYCDLEVVIDKFVDKLNSKTLKTLKTIQFQIFQRNSCIPKSNFSCQIQIRRDMRKSVLKLKLYAKIQGNSFIHLANVWGDGVVISTPLGSMGRNLSLSGPILYKSIQTIMIVPISPLSLNFRPIILPSTSQIIIEVDESSRSPAQVFADGQMIFEELTPTSQIILARSTKKSELVKGLSSKSTQQQWITCLRSVLSWGQNYNSSQAKFEQIKTQSSQNSF